MIALGADHGGYQLKETIKKHLEERAFPTKISAQIPQNRSIRPNRRRGCARCDQRRL